MPSHYGSDKHGGGANINSPRKGGQHPDFANMTPEQKKRYLRATSKDFKWQSANEE